jgi:hypothetical protein
MNAKLKSLIKGFTTAMALLPGLGHSQTIVSGPNISGTWSPSGNPYILASSCTVPCGQTLTIQPGTVVWMGAGVSITANGNFQAVGTAQQRITFQAPAASQFWDSLYLYPCDYSITNHFRFCDFVNATNALNISDPYAGTISTEILNCSFSNCVSSGIYVTVGGNVMQIQTIKNCNFNNSSNGCVINLLGTSGCCAGYDNAAIMGNIFRNLTGAALQLKNAIGGNSPALFQNNTVVNCRAGVVAADPWDARVQDCLFVGCTNAVMATGTQSRAVGFNGFYGNATNFTGYPSSYGLILLANRNSTSCDILYNIFEDPKFVATNDFYLQTNSPAIDAGIPDLAYTDMCFPPSQGASFPDLGAYGGPDAANWLDVVPKVPALATVTYSNKITRLNWGAIPRSEYLVQYLTNFVTAGTNKWLNFTNGDVLAIAKPNSLIVATNQNQPKKFFRIQSLGRPAGN